MKRAKLFQNGQSQAVRLPKEFRFSGKEVYIKKVGSSALLIPVENLWKEWEESLGKVSKDFMSDRNQPKLEDREPL